MKKILIGATWLLTEEADGIFFFVCFYHVIACVSKLVIMRWCGFFLFSWVYFKNKTTKKKRIFFYITAFIVLYWLVGIFFIGNCVSYLPGLEQSTCLLVITRWLSGRMTENLKIFIIFLTFTSCSSTRMSKYFEMFSSFISVFVSVVSQLIWSDKRDVERELKFSGNRTILSPRHSTAAPSLLLTLQNQKHT